LPTNSKKTIRGGFKAGFPAPQKKKVKIFADVFERRPAWKNVP